MEPDWINGPLSRIFVSDSARELIEARDILESLVRHSALDWGELGVEYAAQNDWVLKRKQGTLLSAFRSKTGVEFYVWTLVRDGKGTDTGVVLRDEYWS